MVNVYDGLGDTHKERNITPCMNWISDTFLQTRLSI